MIQYKENDENKNSTKITSTKTVTNISSYTPSTSKHNYPILEYQEEFKSNYLSLKGSLAHISGNISNYKNEISRLEEFLVFINDHEKNYKLIIKKFENLQKNIEDTIEIENLIAKLSSNQQTIDMSEYVNLYNRVKKIIKFFNELPLMDKEDYINNMKKLMYRGFKVYEESFYTILKRYDQLESSSNVENERLNLLNKIKNLARCLQDDEIKFDFTKTLIIDRSEKICLKFDDILINSHKNMSEENFTRNKGVVANLLIESVKIFTEERFYIFEIFDECEDRLKSQVYRSIMSHPMEKIIQNLKDLVNRHNKSNIKKIDFYQNLDVLNIWHSTIHNSYKSLIQAYRSDIFENMSALIKLIEIFSFNYVNGFLKEINNFNEKIENENVLKICNDTIFFLSNLLNFDYAFEFIKFEFKSNQSVSNIKGDFSAEMFIECLITKIETKATLLDKKYSPLKFIFLINNVYFIQSKIAQSPFNKFISKYFTDSLNKNIRAYVEGYLKSCWGKVDEVTFNDRENQTAIAYETDGKTLKNSSKEMIKKKFAIFNDTMKINMKFQQHIQIIDRSLENLLINENVNHIADRYEAFYNTFNPTGFTKFRNKYIVYSSKSDVIQDLKIYFMPDNIVNK
jgi:hypothetical protein